MRRIVFLVLLAVFLAGCGGSSGIAPKVPHVPGTQYDDVPNSPDDLFTGEPTKLVVKLTRQASAFRIMSAKSSGNAIANIRVSWSPMPYGREEYVAYRQIPLDDSGDVVFEVPAKPGYKVEVFAYRLPSELLEVGTQMANAVANSINTVNVTLTPPSYDLRKPEYMFSGGPLRGNWSITPTSPLLSADVLLGFNQWSINGVAGLWSVNKANEGWVLSISSGDRLPMVSAPRKLYYQVELCTLRYLSQDDTIFCTYYPDLPGDLPYIWVYPDQESMP